MMNAINAHPYACTVGPTVLSLGDPRLTEAAIVVADFSNPMFTQLVKRLKEALVLTQANQPHCTALAATQLGIPRRFLVIQLPEGMVVLVNPQIIWHSHAQFSLWERCACCPELLVAVRRHCSISIRFQDEKGRLREWNNLQPELSALLQHKLDHLDGRLILDHAVNAKHIITRTAYNLRPEYFDQLVDFSTEDHRLAVLNELLEASGPRLVS